MRPYLRALIVLLLATGASSAPANARLQPDLICFEPDIEWPLPCDDDD